jgi:hypothetical protein
MSHRAYAKPVEQVTFSGGDAGPWRILGVAAVTGEGLPVAARLTVTTGDAGGSPALWRLRGSVSHARYATRAEVTSLGAVQPPTGRREAVMASLIPIRKAASWWALAQDERRAIFEEKSRHTRTGMDYLPQIARRLHHSRDLGEPFDFLTWFEFAPEHEGLFDQLLERLRASPEWVHVDREVDVRLLREAE